MATETREIAPATPLPWRMDSSLEPAVEDGIGESVATAESYEDARYIVHAANCYPDLLAALKLVVQRAPYTTTNTCEASVWFGVVKAAISKAEGRDA